MSFNTTGLAAHPFFPFFPQKSKSDKPVRLSRDDIIIERLVQIALRRQTSVFPQKVKARFRPGCRWDASLNLVAGLFADAPCMSSLYLDAISYYYWWRHFWEASRVPLWFNKSALFLVASGNTSDLKTAGEPSLPCKSFAFSKTLFLFKLFKPF